MDASRGIGSGGSVELAALAARAQEAACAVRRHAGAAQRAGTLPWRGAAADAFAARLQEAADQAASVAALLDAVSDRVREHSARADARAAAVDAWARAQAAPGGGTQRPGSEPR